jgi:DNA invertase Pin-like site-specific DNA recombinase
MNAHPAAYLRRSYVDPESPGDISRESQRATVRRLAAADGHNGNLVEYDDWGVSADVAKSAKRTAYTQLLADMESGRITAVYAFDVDRLYRDPRDLIRLQDAAQRHQVRVVTTSGELPIGDGADPTAEAFAFIGAVFGGTELKKAKKRARAARDARKARGDAFGRPSYGYRMERQADGRVLFVRDHAEPIEPVLAAFEEAGSFAGAARLLNQRQIPTKRGKRWAGNVVNRLIRRERPGMVPRGRSEPRVAPRGTHLFSRLLRCHCGRLMTPRVTRHTTKYGSYGPYVGYQCYNGRHDPAHPRPYMVSEPAITEWARAEASRFRVPGDKIAGTIDNAHRAELEAQREDLGWAVVNRLLSREAAKAKSDAIDAELATLDAAAEAIDIPQAIDWERWRAADINAVLRTYWEYIEVDVGMLPVKAEWRLPAEYLI